MKEYVLLGWTIFVLLAEIIRTVAKAVLLYKAGKHWWYGIIPVVSEYQILAISWKRRWLPVYLIAETIRSFLSMVVRVFISDWTLLIGSLMAPVFVYGMTMMCVIYFVFMITLCANLALHFGRSKEFGFAMAVLPIVFGPILAFGKNKYNKNAEKWMVV